MYINTLRQSETPLNKLFFSEFNTNLIQRGIRQHFKNKTGIAIDYQNINDVFVIMRTVFINNSGDPYSDVEAQVRMMNEQVLEAAYDQIQTGMSQYIAYNKELDTLTTPLAKPINTSTTGTKIEDAKDNIGIKF
jgi:hypothetical protein